MKVVSRTVFLVATLLAALLSACASIVETPTPTPTPIAASLATRTVGAIPLRAQGGHVFVPAAINGTDAGLFLFDTGAEVSAIEVGLARSTKLPAGREATAVGVAGEERFRYAMIRSLGVAGIALPVRELAAMSFTRFSRGAGFPLHGIVGYNAVRHAPFTLDLRGRTLTLHPRGSFVPPPGAARVPLQRGAPLPVISADLGNGRRVPLIVDSGMDNALMLPTAALRRWPDILARRQTTPGRSTGVGGSIASTGGVLREVALLGTTMRHVDVTFEDPPYRVPGQMAAGRIGNALLREFVLTFDAGAGVVYARAHGR